MATHSESACNAGDPSLIPGSGRCPRERNIYPLQYSCLENPTDRGAWWATVHGIAKSWTGLSDDVGKALSTQQVPEADRTRKAEEDSLAVQWLELCATSAGPLGSIPG